jgi:cytochrome c biogenesis protein CcdA
VSSPKRDPSPTRPSCLAGRWLFIFVLGAIAALSPLGAIETGPAASALTPSEIEQFRASGIPTAVWPHLLENLGSKEHQAAVRELVFSLEPFPAAQLVARLTHEKLAVRLGALELLEDAAGETFGFDPWLDEPAGGANAAALERWNQWAATGAASASASAPSLTEETFRGLAIEIMSGQRERAERAMARLEAFGLHAIARIELFLEQQPALEPGPRAALKAAAYRLALLPVMPRRAVALSRDLALGAPDAQSFALAELGKGGPAVLPIIADFIDSRDALLRETAIDAAGEAAGKHAAPLVLERIRAEKVESVLHPMLRLLGKHSKDDASIDAVARFLDHSSENVVITAIEALAGMIGDNHSALIAPKLSDARWRVRAAAVETAGEARLSSLSAKVIALLDDPDEYVRATAVAALSRLDATEHRALMLAKFLERDELKPAILGVFLNTQAPPPDSVWSGLEKAQPQIILQCLDLLADRNDYRGKRVPYAARFAKHPDPDVSAAALRILAGRGRHTALLLEALRSEDTTRQNAVLDALRLPQEFLGKPADGASTATTESTGNSALDRLYRLAAKIPRAPRIFAGEDSEAYIPGEHAEPAVLREALERFFRGGSPRQRFQAALVLTSQGDASAARHLLATLATTSSLDRRMIATTLGTFGKRDQFGFDSTPATAGPQWPNADIGELATRLLRDDADDVREQAIDAWVEHGDASRLGTLLDELSRPGSKLKPDDLYNYYLDSMVQRPGAADAIRTWAKAILDDPSRADPLKVFAIVLIARSGQLDAIPLAPHTESRSHWIRRAAWKALGLEHATGHLDRILNDESAMVRAVLPQLAAPQDGAWLHWFDDTSSTASHDNSGVSFYFDTGDSSGFGSKKKPAAETAPAIIAALEKLSRDPSDVVRFEALYALLRLGKPGDPATFVALFASQPHLDSLRYRIKQTLEKDYMKLPRGYRVLVPLASEIEEKQLPAILRHFAITEERPFTSFSAMAESIATDPPTSTGGPPPQPEPAPPQPPEPARAEPFRVIYFEKPGCRDCRRVEDMLARQREAFPQMTLLKHSIEDSDAVLLNEALSARFNLPERHRLVTPAVFTQAGPLVHDDITFGRLADLMRSAAALEPDPAWDQIAQPERAAAESTVTQRYAALSLGVVAAAGLLDGINPCAFATIIFLLSYLQVARRTPREMLAVGGAFISAVFLSYFVVGLGLAHVLAKVSALRVAGAVLNYTLAAFALLVAVLSFRDATLAARGQLGAMTLQLPGALKDQIRGVIRTGTRSSRFVLAAFGAGVVISLLELACTGQVYLPTILYMLRSGQGSAFGHLVLYNLAFITPLIIIFGLAWTGLRSDALIRFQKERTALVKTLTGLLFLGLTAFLLFGHLLTKG